MGFDCVPGPPPAAGSLLILPAGFEFDGGYMRTRHQMPPKPAPPRIGTTCPLCGTPKPSYMQTCPSCAETLGATPDPGPLATPGQEATQ